MLRCYTDNCLEMFLICLKCFDKWSHLNCFRTCSKYKQYYFQCFYSFIMLYLYYIPEGSHSACDESK